MKKPSRPKMKRPAPKAKAASEGVGAETVTEEPKLTIKQELFCQAYIEFDGKASDAYRKAYNTESMKQETVHEAACRLLKNSKVAARVETLREDILARHQVTIDRVIAEYAKLAFSSMGDFMRVDADGLPRLDLSALTRAQSSAIAEVTCEMLRTEKDGDDRLPVLKAKIKLADKRGALDSLSRVLGIFIDKHELTGAGGEKLIPDTASSRDLARSVLEILREARIDEDGEPGIDEAGAALADSIDAAPGEAPVQPKPGAAHASPRVKVFNPSSGTLE